jgi:hypothetical protein
MTDVKLVRFAAVLVVLAGYAFVFRSGEARIGAQAAENARSAERLAAGERTLAARDALERERTRLRAQLRLADLASSRGELVARYVRDAAALAAARRCAIVAIAASGPQTSTPVAIPTPPADDPFEAIALETTVEGRYVDVLSTIRALSASRVLAAVDVASIARKNANAPDATVSAVLHVALERLAPIPTAEAAGARTR